MAASWVYSHPLFAVLLSGYFVNILFSALSRFPYKRLHIPFLITHLGLLMILTGQFLKLEFGQQLQVFLPLGQKVNFGSSQKGCSLLLREREKSDRKMTQTALQFDFEETDLQRSLTQHKPLLITSKRSQITLDDLVEDSFITRSISEEEDYLPSSPFCKWLSELHADQHANLALAKSNLKLPIAMQKTCIAEPLQLLSIQYPTLVYGNHQHLLEPTPQHNSSIAASSLDNDNYAKDSGILLPYDRSLKQGEAMEAMTHAKQLEQERQSIKSLEQSDRVQRDQVKTLEKHFTTTLTHFLKANLSIRLRDPNAISIDIDQPYATQQELPWQVDIELKPGALINYFCKKNTFSSRDSDSRYTHSHPIFPKDLFETLSIQAQTHSSIYPTSNVSTSKSTDSIYLDTFFQNTLSAQPTQALKFDFLTKQIKRENSFALIDALADTFADAPTVPSPCYVFTMKQGTSAILLDPSPLSQECFFFLLLPNPPPNTGLNAELFTFEDLHLLIGRIDLKDIPWVLSLDQGFSGTALQIDTSQHSIPIDAQRPSDQQIQKRLKHWVEDAQKGFDPEMFIEINQDFLSKTWKSALSKWLISPSLWPCSQLFTQHEQENFHQLLAALDLSHPQIAQLIPLANISHTLLHQAHIYSQDSKLWIQHLQKHHWPLIASHKKIVDDPWQRVQLLLSQIQLAYALTTTNNTLNLHKEGTYTPKHKEEIFWGLLLLSNMHPQSYIRHHEQQPSSPNAPALPGYYFPLKSQVQRSKSLFYNSLESVATLRTIQADISHQQLENLDTLNGTPSLLSLQLTLNLDNAQVLKNSTNSTKSTLRLSMDRSPSPLTHPLTPNLAPANHLAPPSIPSVTKTQETTEKSSTFDITAALVPKRVLLGGHELLLLEAKETFYPNSLLPMSYDASVLIDGKKVDLSMNHVYETKTHWRFYLSSMQQKTAKTSTPSWVVLTASRDPFKNLTTYPGTALVALGTFLLFIPRKRKRVC